MLTKIRIQNAFVHKDATFVFPEGHTVISGKNGKGKSLIAEMAQYALWGTKALRGEADDYKKLQVDLWFLLKGKNYHISRSARNATLTEVTEAGELSIASGTKPVNAAVPRLFGYSFDVFQIANAANQGAIARLSTMLPTERRKMVDETIGLNIIDILEKFITDSAKDARVLLGSLQANHSEPQTPIQPADYRPVAELDADLKKLRTELKTLEILQSQANIEVSMPVPPEPVNVSEPLDELRIRETAYQQDVAERRQAQAQLSKLPQPREEVSLHVEDAQLEQYETEKKYEDDITTARASLTKSIGDTPRTSAYSVEDLDAIDAQIDLAERWDKKQNLLQAQQLNHCPKCDHEWHTPDPRLSEYEDVPSERPTPPLSRAEEKRLLEIAVKVRHTLPLYGHLDNCVSKYPDRTATIAAIKSARTARSLYENSLGYDQQRTELTERLAQPTLTSWAPQIQQVEGYERAMVAYNTAVARANADTAARDIAREAVGRFPDDLPVQVAVVEAQARACLVYDQQLSGYATAKKVYNARAVEITAVEAQIEEWAAARTAMAEVRSTVKGYLLPSLNKVASNLLAQMTGGELNYVHVDEEFDIKIEGVKIDKLSGAGKDVANLALRLGLGTVLTNQSFSCLLLDEIDQGCDKERAQYISQCLNNLTKTFKQVIVISHKEGLVADHRIEL